jgi:uncharacterized membrane protein
MSDKPRSHRAVLWAASVLASVYAAWFGAYTCIQHLRFKFWAFDLGTFDQGIWLAGHTTDPFVTVRGLPLLGDHVRVFSYVLAPVYWIVDDVRALLVLQSVAIAAGAFFVCRIALRALPARPLLALALSASFLLHPANQNLNLDHAHPDAFAMTFLLASVDFLGAGRLVAFAVAAALAMSCKEDVPLVFAALGAVMMLDRGRRRLGFTIAAAASAYFLFAMLVVLPHFNGAGFFRLGPKGFLGNFWHHGTEASWLLEKLTGTETWTYVFQIGATNLYLFLLAPLAVVPALPALAANLISDAEYMRNLEFHYQTSVVAFLYVATVSALGRLERLRVRLAASPKRGSAVGASVLGGFLALLPLAFVGAAVATNLAWSRVPIRNPGLVREAYTMLKYDRRDSRAREVLAMIPPDAAVSADYSSVPHLSHRRRIYMFPNPFAVDNWGIDGERTHDPDTIEYIGLRNVHSNESSHPIVEKLIREKKFRRVLGDEFLALYQRVDFVKLSPNATCGDFDGDGAVTKDDQRYVGEAIMRGRECPLHVCDADGNGSLEYRDVFAMGRRVKDPVVKLACPAVD